MIFHVGDLTCLRLANISLPSFQSFMAASRRRLMVLFASSRKTQDVKIIMTRYISGYTYSCIFADRYGSKGARDAEKFHLASGFGYSDFWVMLRALEGQCVLRSGQDFL